MKHILSVLVFALALFPSLPTFAFNGVIHEQITHSAFLYLNTTPNTSPEIKSWLANGNLFEKLLIHAAVDTDYQPNIWIDLPLHSPFTGEIKKDNPIIMFTSLTHYMKMGRKGKYWDIDGYSYKSTTKKGNDAYLGVPFVSLVGTEEQVSWDPLFAEKKALTAGFHNRFIDWEQSGDRFDASDVVFPPANIVAQRSYDQMLQSSPAQYTVQKSWDYNLTLIPNSILDLFKGENKLFKRHYWSAEIAELPTKLEFLGTTLHMAQDMGVPHHAEATMNFCHAEFESAVDLLACAGTPPNASAYDNGLYDFGMANRMQSCQGLYDKNMVTKIRAMIPAFQLNTPISIANRIKEIAAISSQWAWGQQGSKITTQLRDGTVYKSSKCADFFKLEKIKNDIRFQYNLAVAASSVIMEVAARDYEINEKQGKTLF